MQGLALGAVLLAALGAGCCVGGRGRDAVTMVAMGLMVLAMLDVMVLGSVLLGPTAWTTVLVGCAIAVATLRRHRPLGLERAGHLAVMALLTGAAALDGLHGGHGATGTAASHEMPGMSSVSGGVVAAAQHGVPGGMLVLIQVAVACGWSGLLMGRSLTCSGRVCAERVADAASLLLMAAMCVLATP